MSSPLKTFYDSLNERFLSNKNVRVTLGNGVKLHGALLAIHADHLVLEDNRTLTGQLVRFDHIASVGDESVPAPV